MISMPVVSTPRRAGLLQRAVAHGVIVPYAAHVARSTARPPGARLRAWVCRTTRSTSRRGPSRSGRPGSPSTTTGVSACGSSLRRRAADRAVSYEDSVIEALRLGVGRLDPEAGRRRPHEAVVRAASSDEHLDATATRHGSPASRPRDGWRLPGRAAVEAAQANGNWTLMDDVDDRVVPDDLAAAFETQPGSREHWDVFSPSAQKQMLAWVVMAKRPATRAQRVTAIAEAAARGEKAVG